MSEENRRRWKCAHDQLQSGAIIDKDAVLQELADMLFDSDVFDPITRDLEIIVCQYELNERVWGEFVALRSGHGVKAEFSKIEAPVVIIHGDYDPHPLEGVEPFLKSCVQNVTVHFIKQCGHYPWIEKHARNHFFDLIRQELQT